MAGQHNPAESKFRMAYELTPTLFPNAGATFHDHLLRSESFSNESEPRQDNSIYAGSQRPRALLGKFVTDGEMEVSVRPEEFSRYFAHAQGKVTTTTPAGGTNSRKHVMAPSSSSTVPSTFAFIADRDDLNPQRFHGGQISNLEFALSADDGILSATIAALFARGDYFSETVVTTDPDVTQKPVIRGLPKYADWNLAAAADSRVHVKVSDITDIGTGVIMVLAKVGAAAYGAIESEVRIGNDSLTGLPYFSKLYDSTTGAILGTLDVPIEINFPSATDLDVDDAWYSNVSYATWSPTYVDTPVFNEIYAGVFIDGQPYCIDEMTLGLSRPVVPRYCIGGRFPAEIRNRGQREVELEFTREYLSVDLRRRLERGEAFKFVLEAFSEVEIESGFPYYLKLVCPLCVPGGRTASVEGQDEMPETITATCHPNADDSEGYVDDLNIEEQNSLTSLVV